MYSSLADSQTALKVEWPLWVATLNPKSNSDQVKIPKLYLEGQRGVGFKGTHKS